MAYDWPQMVALYLPKSLWGACFHNLLANQFPLVNMMVSVLGCSHTLMYTHLYQIYTHTSDRSRGGEEKGWVGGSRKRGGGRNTTRKMGDVEDTGMKCLILFYLLQKRKTKERKKKTNREAAIWSHQTPTSPLLMNGTWASFTQR